MNQVNSFREQQEMEQIVRSEGKMKIYLSKINPDMREAILNFLRRRAEFYFSPASRTYHHSYAGGLFDHTMEVCDIGLKIIISCNLNLDIEHYLVAAILHDTGKVGRYEWDRDSNKWKLKESQKSISESNHEFVPILDFYDETGVALTKDVKKAILSHMGGWSKIAYPNDLLSAVLHAADLISSHLKSNPSSKKDLNLNECVD